MVTGLLRLPVVLCLYPDEELEMSTLKDSLERSFLEVKDTKINYPFAPIPCQMDEQISCLIKLFIKFSPVERLVFYEMAEPISGFLNTFAERCATLAVRERSVQRILEGLA